MQNTTTPLTTITDTTILHTTIPQITTQPYATLPQTTPYTTMPHTIIPHASKPHHHSTYRHAPQRHTPHYQNTHTSASHTTVLHTTILHTTILHTTIPHTTTPPHHTPPYHTPQSRCCGLVRTCCLRSGYYDLRPRLVTIRISCVHIGLGDICITRKIQGARWNTDTSTNRPKGRASIPHASRSGRGHAYTERYLFYLSMNRSTRSQRHSINTRCSA